MGEGVFLSVTPEHKAQKIKALRGEGGRGGGGGRGSQKLSEMLLRNLLQAPKYKPEDLQVQFTLLLAC